MGLKLPFLPDIDPFSGAIRHRFRRFFSVRTPEAMPDVPELKA